MRYIQDQKKALLIKKENDRRSGHRQFRIEHTVLPSENILVFWYMLV